MNKKNQFLRFCCLHFLFPTAIQFQEFFKYLLLFSFSYIYLPIKMPVSFLANLNEPIKPDTSFSIHSYLWKIWKLKGIFGLCELRSSTLGRRWIPQLFNSAQPFALKYDFSINWYYTELNKHRPILLDLSQRNPYSEKSNTVFMTKKKIIKLVSKYPLFWFCWVPTQTEKIADFFVKICEVSKLWIQIGPLSTSHK